LGNQGVDVNVTLEFIFGEIICEKYVTDSSDSG